MASCSKIDHMLQAYIDDELSNSEQVILERHLSACPDCQALLHQHRASAAELYETLAANKLSRDLRQPVLDHLPEMDYPPMDVAGLNKRAKHPQIYRERLLRLVPIAAAGLLVFLAYLISQNWPAAEPRLSSPIGMITAIRGDAVYIPAELTERFPVELQSLTGQGDRYETGPNAQLMISLAGSSHVKLDQNSRICVYDDREIRIEKGQAYFDVGKDNRIFKVLTPSGDITVFGTAFNVDVSIDHTSVAVEEGEVQVEVDDLFRQITPGQAINIAPGLDTLKPYTLDVSQTAAWATSIQPDDTARVAYQSAIESNTSASKVMGHSGYLLQNINNRRLKQLELAWTPDPGTQNDRAEYLVYVYSENNEPIFKSRITAAQLNSPDASVIVTNTNEKPVKARQAYVKLIPDMVSGTIETRFTKCQAILSDE